MVVDIFTRGLKKKIDGSVIVYPGPLFGSSFQDLEETAKGENVDSTLFRSIRRFYTVGLLR